MASSNKIIPYYNQNHSKKSADSGDPAEITAEVTCYFKYIILCHHQSILPSTYSLYGAHIIGPIPLKVRQSSTLHHFSDMSNFSRCDISVLLKEKFAHLAIHGMYFIFESDFSCRRLLYWAGSYCESIFKCIR